MWNCLGMWDEVGTILTGYAIQAEVKWSGQTSFWAWDRQYFLILDVNNLGSVCFREENQQQQRRIQVKGGQPKARLPQQQPVHLPSHLLQVLSRRKKPRLCYDRRAPSRVKILWPSLEVAWKLKRYALPFFQWDDILSILGYFRFLADWWVGFESIALGHSWFTTLWWCNFKLV